MEKRAVILIVLALIIIGTIATITLDTKDTEGSNDGNNNSAGNVDLKTTADGTRYVSDPDSTQTEQKPAIVYIGDEERGESEVQPETQDASAPQEATNDGNIDAAVDGGEAVEVANESGVYIDYDAEAVRTAASQGSAVLFFHASWCPTCRALNQALQGSQIPSGVSIFKIDYDSADELKRKYRVTRQHTLVQVDTNLDALQSWSGSRTIQDIVSRL